MDSMIVFARTLPGRCLIIYPILYFAFNYEINISILYVSIDNLGPLWKCNVIDIFAELIKHSLRYRL